ncbi:MAG: hypothetical protein ABJG68_06805 [Crocinitomicaceae bacterium]
MASFARADQWDNLTHDQANKVTHFLNKHPFIIDYCDCCGEGESAYLIKVISSEIVPCEWDKKKFSVIVKGKRITKFQVSSRGIDDYHTDPIDQEVEYTIYMNYTFVYDHHMKWAVPFHKIVDYPNNGPICFGATIYPNPAHKGVHISDEDYKTWYAKHIAKD